MKKNFACHKKGDFMRFLCFLFFFLGGGEQDIVQNQPVSRRIRIHVQLGRRVTHDMSVILRIMPSEEGPEAIPEVAMDVAVFIESRVVA